MEFHQKNSINFLKNTSAPRLAYVIQKVLCFEFLINGPQNGIFGLRQDSQKIVNIKLIILKLLTN